MTERKELLLSLDIESTGLSIRRDEPMEIGIIVQDDVRKEVHSYVKPTVKCTKKAREIHKITDEMVKDAPNFADARKAMFESLKKILNGRKGILVGHNICRYDIRLLEDFSARMKLRSFIAELEELGVTEYVDTFDVAVYIGEKKKGLKDIYVNKFGKMFEKQHSALGDAHAVLDLFDSGWCAPIGQPLNSLFS